jgi:nucleoid-associated protein YgaU
MKIFNANTDQLSNPDLIKPGQELKIPNPWLIE